MNASWILLIGAVLLGAQEIAAPPAERENALRHDVERILARPELDGAVVGVEVRSLSDHRRVFESNATKTFIPASNQKLLTLALALFALGPDHEFATPLLVEQAPAPSGVLSGDLWVRGSGDPSLHPRFFESQEPEAALAPFVEALKGLGVRRIGGDLVVDDRIFDREFLAPGWPADQLDKDYCSPVGGLSFNANCLDVLVSSSPAGAPSVRVRPELPGLEIVRGELRVSEKPRDMIVWLLRPDERDRLVVGGQVGPAAGAARFAVPVRDPALYFGQALAALLGHEGVVLEGEVRRPRDDEVAPPRALYTRKSPLLPALYVCGKESDNLIAEHLLKASAAAGGEQGSFAAGARLCADFLRASGVDTAGFHLVDGSGLSRLDQVTPRLLVDLLAAMYDSPVRDPFLRALPITGVDGTLRQRMGEPQMRSRVRAKTGYLLRVSTLSGYVFAGAEEDSEVFAFSILINGFERSNAEMKRIQDDVCRAIASLRP